MQYQKPYFGILSTFTTYYNICYPIDTYCWGIWSKECNFYYSPSSVCSNPNLFSCFFLFYLFSFMQCFKQCIEFIDCGSYYITTSCSYSSIVEVSSYWIPIVIAPPFISIGYLCSLSNVLNVSTCYLSSSISFPLGPPSSSHGLPSCTYRFNGGGT